jgi:cell fate regulator YaaT (PSP1 superfamily)
MAKVVLVRYGAIPEVSRFQVAGNGDEARGDCVVVRTHRGLQLGVVLNEIRDAVSSRSPGTDSSDAAQPPDAVEELPPILRRATEEDRVTDERLRGDARATFDSWQKRIQEWKLDLELIDLEWTIDRQKLILYVLNSRGPDCTRLALQAAAAGLGVVEVQPVTAVGLVTVPSASGGCGTCGCH